MLWNLLIASVFIGTACAVHLEYLKIDSAEEPLDGSLDEDLPMSEVQLPGACWVCKWAMQNVKKHVSSKSTVETIKGQLATVCDGIGFLRFICKALINKYMDTLAEELSTTDNPKTICVNIGICSSVSMQELTKAFLRKYPKI
ncbi:antimicrobial peptide NK-lysin-like isoform X2 [Tachysurus vachellii]|uniref:antimicrobial peptide NK-lysin-like isoform X2 n=1 Tax=Tachysurus vachellii TaxID=175792 RepID=UPI00296B187F|nr:antimicrobial peptide NK-lysin-like isoform X2 [Tachysurus vachellii]